MPMIAWYGDMELKHHILNVVNSFSISATIIFLKPINSKNYHDRKDMTFMLQNVIELTYSDNLNV